MCLFIGHLKTSETVVCLEGCLEWVFYEELPNMDAGGPVHDGEVAADESCFAEVARFRFWRLRMGRMLRGSNLVGIGHIGNL